MGRACRRALDQRASLVLARWHRTRGECSVAITSPLRPGSPRPARAAHQVLRRSIDRPFLLENNVCYFRYPGQEFTEERFLNELCDRSGCGVLLDLHNLHTNAVNHGFNATTYLRDLNMDHVVEIHIAGGVSMMGFHTDSHTGPVAEPVWQLLEQTVPRASNLRGVTFEFHESSYGVLGEGGILEQIDRARNIVRGQARVVTDVTPGVQRAVVDLTLAYLKGRSCREGRDDTLLASYDLTPLERDRIIAIVSQPGMSVHCSLSRGNRLEVVFNAFPMTCVLLGPNCAA